VESPTCRATTVISSFSWPRRPSNSPRSRAACTMAFHLGTVRGSSDHRLTALNRAKPRRTALHALGLALQLGEEERRGVEHDLGFGRSVVSELEVPTMSASVVWSVQAAAQSDNATEP
jgi:hypothetical protein